MLRGINLSWNSVNDADDSDCLLLHCETLDDALATHESRGGSSSLKRPRILSRSGKLSFLGYSGVVDFRWDKLGAMNFANWLSSYILFSPFLERFVRGCVCSFLDETGCSFHYIDICIFISRFQYFFHSMTRYSY